MPSFEREATGHSPAAAARLRAACVAVHHGAAARADICARCLCMQAVICWTLGISWPHSRMASPVHICCASDAEGGAGAVRKAPLPRRRGRREELLLLVRRKVIDAFPKVARGAGRYSSGALHAACAAARVIHHPGATRCGCSISTDVRIGKRCARPSCELCANDREAAMACVNTSLTVACTPRRAKRDARCRF